MMSESFKKELIEFYNKKGEKITFDYYFTIKAVGIFSLKDKSYSFIIPVKEKFVLSLIAKSIYTLNNNKEMFVSPLLKEVIIKPKKYKYIRSTYNKKLSKQIFRNRWNRHR